MRLFLSVSLLAAAVPLGVAKAAASPGHILYAVIGAADPTQKVPAVNAVPGAGVSNVAVPYPVFALSPKVAYTVTIGAQTAAYSGPCTASYTLALGAKGQTVISHYATVGLVCEAQSLWTFPFPVDALPNRPGPALLTAKIRYGSVTVISQTPLTIQ